MKKPKLTAEQRAERRLWTNADKHCRALMESLRTSMRIGSLSFNVRDGLTAHLVLKIEVESTNVLTTTRKGNTAKWIAATSGPASK